jgi:integrase
VQWWRTCSHFQRILDAAPTASVGAHLGRVLTALVGAGLEEGYLLPRQDVLRGVRWRSGTPTAAGPAGRAITEAEIPTTAAVHALARAAAERSGVWWREAQILFVAYSGLRWGEHVALSADRLDAGRRRVTVDRQVVETRSALRQSLPKGRRRRLTMFPATTPGGVDLAGMIDARLGELPADGLVFPDPRGGRARRSNYGRNLWDPAARAVGWPRDPEGGWAWTFHSLRHVFATWALAQEGIRIEDVSRLLGHSSIRVTQEIYIHVTDDVYDRLYAATR